MDLITLADFNLVAVHGGFGRASRATGHPKATLSRRVRALEESLQVRLIERGGRELRLTPEGALLHARTLAPFEDIAQAAEDLRAGVGRPRGVLRVSAPLLFAHVAMGRLGAAFRVAYPDVRLEVTAEDRLVDLVHDGYDVVLRVNPRPDDALVGRRFLTDHLALVAPAGWPVPRGGKTGAQVEIPAVTLTRDSEDTSWSVNDASGKTRQYQPRPVLRLSSLLLVRDAVLAGAGAALLPRSVIAADLAAGRLAEWGSSNEPAVEGWVLHASRRLVSPKVSAFVEFLCERFTWQTV